MSDWKKDLGERLRISREKARLTQKEVADELNISQPTYSQYEAGARLPSLEVFLQLVRVLGSSADYLLTGFTSNDVHLDPETVELLKEFKALQPKDRGLFWDVIRLLQRYS